MDCFTILNKQTEYNKQKYTQRPNSTIVNKT